MIPEPDRNIFRGRILQTGNVVEIIMIEMIFDERFYDLTDFRIIDQPTGMRIDFTFEMKFKTKAMTVKSFAFMAVGYVGKKMSGVEAEFFSEFDFFHEVLPELKNTFGRSKSFTGSGEECFEKAGLI